MDLQFKKMKEVEKLLSALKKVWRSFCARRNKSHDMCIYTYWHVGFKNYNVCHLFSHFHIFSPSNSLTASFPARGHPRVKDLFWVVGA